MNKINIVCLHNTGFLWLPWVEPCISKYVNVKMYDPNINYDKKSTIIFVDNCHVRSKIFDKMKLEGYRIIFNNLMEATNSFTHAYTSEDTDYCYVLHNVNWFWYQESMLNKLNKLDNYVPSRSYKNLALMPMRAQNWNRNTVINHLAPYLSDFIWSYVAQGKVLPNDCGNIDTDPMAQRYFNPEWYNNTCFSLVIESSVNKTSDQPIFITEKTFKPIAFKHPFIIYSYPNTLTYLKSLGFETFNNLFDESYDNFHPENSSYEKLIRIENIIKTFKKEPYDTLTLKKIEHNCQHFYNQELVFSRFKEEIIDPLLEYVNS